MQKIIIIFISFLLISLFNCGKSFEPNHLYGNWSLGNIDCQSPELTEEVKNSGIQLSLEKQPDGQYGKITGKFPLNGEIKEFQGNFTAKYDQGIDKMELIFNTQEVENTKIYIHSLSASEMQTGETIKGIYCKIHLKK
jgi:hypothetical protein